MATIVNVQDPSTSNNLAVDSSGRIGVNNFPSVQTIQGTVNVALFPSVQPVSGAIDVTDRSLRQLGIVTVANGGIGTNTAPAYTVIQDPTSNAHKMAINADGSINVSGSITASNPSVSATGAAVPASATYLGGNKSGNITGLALDGSGNLNVNIQAGTVTATNPSVGTDGSAIPTSSTLIGASDGTNLQQLLVESSSNRNLRTGIYSGANEATVTGSNALKVDNSAVTQPISAASLPLPTGASTVAKQPALGTAGTASSDVITVQGIASMTALKTDGSGVTQPISGTVTVQQATAANLKVDLSGTAVNATAIKVDNSGVTQPVSGTITSNIGTTNGLALDTSVNGVIVSQGSTTSGEKGPLVQGAVTTGSPTYTTTQTSPISLTTAGAMRVDASATTQPVSGTITANQGGTWTVQPGNTANTTAWKVDGSAVTQPVSGTITANAGTNLNTSLLALETGGNLASAKTNLDNIKTYTSAFADTSTSNTVTNDGDVVSIALPGGQATALVNILIGTLVGTLLFEASPDSGTTWVSVSGSQAGTSSVATSTTTAGAWRVNVAGFTNFRIRLHPTTSGTSGAITVRVTQGVHNIAVINASTLGQTTMANSAPVVIASDQSAVKTKSDFSEQASLSTTGAAPTDLLTALDVSAYKGISLQITTVATGGTLQVQGSNDNINFFAVVVNSTSGVQSLFTNITAVGIYYAPINFRYLRVRETAWTSGSTTGTVELFTVFPALTNIYTSTALSTGSSSIGGIGTVTTGGSSDSHLVSAASTNATLIKSSAGQVYGYEIYNTNAAVRYVKLTNASSAPTPGTTLVFRTIGVPPTGRASFHSATGLTLGTGIGFYTCTGIADNDATAVGASDLVIDIDWK